MDRNFYLIDINDKGKDIFESSFDNLTSNLKKFEKK
jgi:hypothetical protein